MSSPPKEKIETKAGHLPAVKVGGGMRIVQKHQSANEVPDKKQEEKDNKEYETEPVLNFLLLHTILLQSRMAAQLKAERWPVSRWLLMKKLHICRSKSSGTVWGPPVKCNLVFSDGWMANGIALRC
ncbi:death-associated protein 1 homolog isoform X2 [Chanodichthys erythropterus]|uniref:death-associated protein 1 homolog isoform X2 n=1 Tax=Chanodichthys erythropterus TaxID=933992 RepID=UPI00351F3E04